MTQVITSLATWREQRKKLLASSLDIGFVPTMGALHAGHQSLLKRCRQENTVSVLSIFLNPTQFNDPTDLHCYPRTAAKDLKIAQQEGVDFLIMPEAPAIYFDNYQYQVNEQSLSKILCGAFRPGHFTGVLTVVLKLLNLVRPDRLYLGEKDYQQYLLIKQMVAAFFLDIDVRVCPTVREVDGLALSSRNCLLSEAQRTLAGQFATVFHSGLPIAQTRARLLALEGIKIDYLEERDGRCFVAVYIGDVRLIDNKLIP